MAMPCNSHPYSATANYCKHNSNASKMFRSIRKQKLTRARQLPTVKEMLPLVRIWILICALATLAGWTLSAFGELNVAGYGVFLAFTIAIGWHVRKKFQFGEKFSRKIFHRLRRPLPLCFLALAILIFIGGAIYPPSNYTGLQYRVARVLQWLAHDGWFWIHSP